MNTNTSGQGASAVLPPEIRGWNWGAFLLNWIWGIGNGTWIALLMFVPLVNFVMPFVLGAMVIVWAWRNRMWRDVAHFKSVQRRWAWAGLILVAVVMPSCMVALMAGMRHSEAYDLSAREIRNNEQVAAALGEPIETGALVMGSISTSGGGGEARIHYSVHGPKAKGEAYVYAARRAGNWKLGRVEVEVEDPSQDIVVVEGKVPPPKESDDDF
jgi:hypothetical protein